MDVKLRQTFILKLLNHVTEPVMYKEIIDIGKNFDVETNKHFFTVSFKLTHIKVRLYCFVNL